MQRREFLAGTAAAGVILALPVAAVAALPADVPAPIRLYSVAAWDRPVTLWMRRVPDVKIFPDGSEIAYQRFETVYEEPRIMEIADHDIWQMPDLYLREDANGNVPMDYWPTNIWRQGS